MTSDITLQINASAGDLDYLDLTIPALVETHRAAVREVVVVFETVRPPSTRLLDADKRFPPERHAERTRLAREKVERLRECGLVDRIELNRDDPEGQRILRIVVGWPLRETHEIGGSALMAYARMVTCVETRYVLHADADMLLHQAAGFDWTAAAREALVRHPDAIAAIPRTSPPLADGAAPRRAFRPLEDRGACWANDWFSTRLSLLDRDRLAPHLPLVRGVYRLKTLFWKTIGRRYPRAFEIIMHQALGPRGLRTLVLKDDRAWSLHPVAKDGPWRAMLPGVLAAVGEGRFPDAQRGRGDMLNEAWQGIAGAAGTVPHP